jgi:hypothetical protein
MSFGIIEIISLLLGLSGFGLHANPKAPTIDQSLAYAIEEPDITIQLDVASLLTDNYKAFIQLPDQPQIKADPELARVVHGVVDQIDAGHKLLQSQFGIDVTSDISDITLFGQLQPSQQPVGVATVHGKFQVSELEKLAAFAQASPPQKVNGATMIEINGNALALTKDGVLLAGTTSLVRERLADTWKAPKHGSGTTLGNVARALEGKPVFAFAVTMSPSSRSHAIAALGGGKNFATDIIQRHKLASVSLFRDGVGWQWIDTSKTGLDAMAEVSEGMVDMLRAAEIAPRGFGKVIVGGLESYRGTSKQIDELLAHKDAMMKIIEAYTSDGSFQKKVDKDPNAMTLSVRLTGKSLSDVMPIGAFLPGMALVYFTMGRASSAPVEQMPMHHVHHMEPRPLRQPPANPWAP